MFFYIFLGLLIVFFIIDILTMFYMSTFIKSIPLFVKDLIGMDRKVFHGYGFWCFCRFRWFR